MSLPAGRIVDTPITKQTLDRMVKRLQMQRNEAIDAALASTLEDLAGDAEVNGVLYWDGTSFVVSAGSTGDGQVFTTVGGVPTWV